MAIVNVLLTTFGGLDLPSTLCLSLPEDVTTSFLFNEVANSLPCQVVQHAYLSTTDGRRIFPCSESLRDISCLGSESRESRVFLPLRLNVGLRGGKGGFGSQLRAAGGRMSSRKKKQNAELATGSARNLDGRRLRTITEAKNLATYLATKPDMDRKEKEERRKRWETVVELAEQREADMRAGKTADGRRKGLSSQWMEEKEEVGENVKNAVKLAMAANDEELNKPKSNSSESSTKDSADEDSETEDPMELDETDMARLRVEAEAGDVDAIWVLQNRLKIPKNLLPRPQQRTPRFAGFDDDLSDSEPDEEIKTTSKSTSEQAETTEVQC